MNRIQYGFSRFHIWLTGGKYLRNQIMTLPDGRTQEVLIFSGKKNLFLAQCTLLRTIIMHESVLSSYSFCNYVLAHEMAHKRQWWNLLFYPFSLLAPIGLYIIVMEAVPFFNGLMALDFSAVLNSVYTFLLAIVLFFIPVAFSWLMEMNADIEAIKTVGFQYFLAIVYSPSQKKRRLIVRIVVGLTHPPDDLTVFIWKKFYRSI